MNSLTVLLLASLLYVGPALATIDINNWSYAGAGDTDQDFWTDINGSSCDGSSQSPINIVTKWTQEIEHAAFDLSSYATGTNARLENNGHALEIEIPEGNHHYDVTGGGLSGTFRAFQFHFHFGSNNNQGSEHTIDGERYPAEIHIVHYDTSYGNASEAIKVKGGIAVLGFFLERDDDDNSALDLILDDVSLVKDPHTHYELEDLRLSELLPSSLALDKFWRYEGSLTTPLCNEVVTWTLFEETIKVSSAQLTTMRTLLSDAVSEDGEEMPMSDNYRKIQSRGIRTIYSVVVDDDGDDGDHTSPSPTDSAGRSTPGAMVILAAFLTTISLRF